MGPRSRDRGIVFGMALAGDFPNGLQWGRGHVTAESVHIGQTNNVAVHASMGPRSRDRGIGQARTPRLSHLQLQWGRGHVTAESAGFDAVPDDFPLLQWGRGHVTAESW